MRGFKSWKSQKMKHTKPKLRPAEGWPKGWYYSCDFDTVNLEALLAPDEYFNRVILGKTVKPRPAAAEDHQPDLYAVPHPVSKA